MAIKGDDLTAFISLLSNNKTGLIREVDGKLQTYLHYTTKVRNAGIVEALPTTNPTLQGWEKTKAFIDQMSRTGETALMLAATQGNKVAVSLLINYGAEIVVEWKEGETALDHAASGENQKIVDILIRNKANVEKSSIYCKTKAQKFRPGPQTKTRICLTPDMEQGHKPRDANSAWTLLMVAAVGGDSEAVRTLLHNKIDLDIIEALSIEGQNALMLWASKGHISVLELLLTAGQTKAGQP